MRTEVTTAYLELAIRMQSLPEHVVESVLECAQDLAEEISEEEVVERVKRLRNGTW